MEIRNNLIEEVKEKIATINFSNNPYNKDFDYFNFHLDRFSYILSRSQNFFKAGDKCLDIGSLFGYVALGEKLIGYEVFGIDLPDYVNQFKNNFAKWGIDNQAVDLAKEKLPYQNDYFDLIIASEILEHLRFHPTTFFTELARVLKPGGKIMITTPNLIRFNNVIKMVLGQSINWDITEDYWDGVHAREFTVKEIKQLASIVNLKVIEVGYENFSYPSLSWIVKLVNKIVGFIFPKRKGNLILILSK